MSMSQEKGQQGAPGAQGQDCSTLFPERWKKSFWWSENVLGGPSGKNPGNGRSCEMDLPRPGPKQPTKRHLMRVEVLRYGDPSCFGACA